MTVFVFCCCVYYITLSFIIVYPINIANFETCKSSVVMAEQFSLLNDGKIEEEEEEVNGQNIASQVKHEGM